MKILITGGAGFAGSAIALKLKTQYPSYSITAFDNLKRRGSELNLPRLKAGSIDFQHGDIRCKEDLFFDQEFDLIIDASAEPSVLAGITSPVEQVVNNNLMGTINCLELAKKHKAAFLFLSTSRVYPIAKLEEVKFEESDTRFNWIDEQVLPGVSSKGVSEYFPLSGSRSFYGTTKLASELLIQEYCELAGVKAVINRCGVLTGPWQMGKVDQGVIVLWIARHIFQGKLGYFGYGGTGKQVRDILHIDDLYRLVDWQIHNIDKINGEIFNVGGGADCSVSLQELTRLCEKATGNKIQIDTVTENRVADIRIYLTDNTYVTQKTGWEPQINPEQIVKDITEWIIENRSILEPILK
ncbi:MAG: NAD-dependent epimerase/dehydratase family protein [Chitinophagaceae bacterium]|jgi:CDP-paratose 2-epimerase